MSEIQFAFDCAHHPGPGRWDGTLGRVVCATCHPLASGPRERTPDEMCEHGMAMDVHCCGCHSGFLFDGMRCTCAETTPGDLTQRVKARAEALSALDAKLGTTYAAIERDALLLADIVSTVRATCIVNLGRPDYPSSHEALRTILKIVGAGNGRQS